MARRGAAAHHHVPGLSASRGAHHTIGPTAIARSVPRVLVVLAVIARFVGVLQTVMSYPRAAMLIITSTGRVIVVIKLRVVACWSQVGMLIPAAHHPLCWLTGEVHLTFTRHELLLWLPLPPQQVLFTAVVWVIYGPLATGTLAVVGCVVTLDLPLLMWRKLTEVCRLLLLLCLRLWVSAPHTFQFVVRNHAHFHRGSG